VRQVMKPFSERDGDDAAEARFKRFLVQLHVRKQQRIHSPGRWVARRWLPIAATIFVAAIFFFEPHAAIIQADELVKQAASVERTRSAGLSQWLRITLTPANRLARPGVGVSSLMLDAEATDGMVVTTNAIMPDSSPARLVTMLGPHHFDWQRPFSLARFTAWRMALARKH